MRGCLRCWHRALRRGVCTAVALALAGAVFGQGTRALAELQRSAAGLYDEGRYADALVEVDEGLAIAPEDERLRTIGAWCHLRRAESDPAHAWRAAAWFSELRRGRELRELSPDVVLGIGRCQQELAGGAATADRRALLAEAERAFTELVGREELVPYALRHRFEVRLALGETEAAIGDARDFEKRVNEVCAAIEARARKARVGDDRRELALRLARRWREIDGVHATLALYRWNAGEHEEARRQVEAFLSREEPPCDEPAVAELLVRVAPDDARVVPAHVYRLSHAREVAARRDAAMALGRLGEKSREAVPALMAATADDSVLVAREAVTSLGMIGPTASEAIPTLEKLVAGGDEPMRQRAAAALRQVRRR